MKSGTKYGLQIRARPSAGAAKKAAGPAEKPSIFNQDDDDEDNVEQAIARQAAKNRALKEVELQHRAALEQDSTVFSYDDVYDDIKSTSTISKRVDKEQGKPKYITKLLDKAKTRQQEQEIIYERKLLKERQREDHMYGDKDKFVTSAYKKKLAEQEKWLEEERIRELEEQAEEVTKKSDLSDFYHHLFSKNVAFGAKKEVSAEGHPSIEQESAEENFDVGKDSEPAKKLENEKVTADDNKEGLDLENAGEQTASVEEEEAKQDGSAKDVISGQPNPKPVDRKPSEDALASAKERYLARKRMRAT